MRSTARSTAPCRRTTSTCSSWARPRSARNWRGSRSARSTGPMSAMSSICRKTEASMSRPRTNRAARRTVGGVATVGVGRLLAACSEDYWVRRDTIALGAGDAIAGNAVTQMIDPWPPGSADKNIAFNGEKMQDAVQRYRTDKVIEPADPGDLQSTNQSGQTINQTTVNAGGNTSSAGTSSATTPGQ